MPIVLCALRAVRIAVTKRTAAIHVAMTPTASPIIFTIWAIVVNGKWIFVGEVELSYACLYL